MAYFKATTLTTFSSRVEFDASDGTLILRSGFCDFNDKSLEYEKFKDIEKRTLL